MKRKNPDDGLSHAPLLKNQKNDINQQEVFGN